MSEDYSDEEFDTLGNIKEEIIEDDMDEMPAEQQGFMKGYEEDAASDEADILEEGLED